MIKLFSILGQWTLGSFVIIDLIASTTNAFNGAILARRMDHNRNWTLAGILMISIIGGIGGSVTRDILLAQIPTALQNPWYILFCLAAASLALIVTKDMALASIRKLFEFMAAFSLPWYAIISAQKALGMDLPLITVILIGLVSTAAGRFFIDLISGVAPRDFTRSWLFVGTAVFAALLYILCDAIGLSTQSATLIAWAIAFAIRLLTLRFYPSEPEPLGQASAGQAGSDEVIRIAQ